MGFWNKFKDFWLAKGDTSTPKKEEKGPRQLQEEAKRSKPMSVSELYFAMISEFVNSYCSYFAEASEPVDTLIFGGIPGKFALTFKIYNVKVDYSKTNMSELTFQAYTQFSLRRDGYKVHYDREMFLNLYEDCQEQIWKQIQRIVREFDRHFKADHPNFPLPIEYLNVDFTFSES